MGVHLPYFAAISGIGWLIDFSIFSTLSAKGFPYSVANFVGATIAVTFVYLAATRIIFRHSQNGPAAAALEYIAWNVFAILLASLAVQKIGMLILLPIPARSLHASIHYAGLNVATEIVAGLVAKLTITPVTMYANYVAMGFIVERRFRFI